MHAPWSTLTLPVAIAPARPFGRRQHDAHRPRPVLAGAAGPRYQLKKAEQQLIFTLAVMLLTLCRSSLPHRLFIMPSGTAPEDRSFSRCGTCRAGSQSGAAGARRRDHGRRSQVRTLLSVRCVPTWPHGVTVRTAQQGAVELQPSASIAQRMHRVQCLIVQSHVDQPPNKQKTPSATAAAPAMRCASVRTSCGADNSSCGTARPRRGRPTGRRGPRGRHRWSKKMRRCALSCCR